MDTERKPYFGPDMVTKEHGDFVYAGDANITRDAITVSPEEWSHLARVRRRREGGGVFASDGRGMVYRCLIAKDRELHVLERLPDFGESSLKLTLISGMLQGDSARDVVKSAVPLGVRNIVWTRMDRSQENYSEGKLDKLKRVAIQSLKQCGRARLPEQSCVGNLDEAMRRVDGSRLWVAQMSTGATHETVTENHTDHTLVVGPEGGFSDKELELASKHGARFLHLGSRRLRSELAVAAGLSALLERAGEY